MKQKVEKAKEFMQAAIPEAKAAGMIGLGMLAAALVGKGVDKLGEQMPAMEKALPWIKAGAMFAVGVGVSTMAVRKQEKPEEFNPVKLLGYGVAGMGVVAAGKAITGLIPGMENVLSGIDFNALPVRYYTESLENIAKASIGEVQQRIETAAANAFDVSLPELEGTDDESGDYNRGTSYDSPDMGAITEVETEDVEFSEVV